jgi:GH15 family glucan-1,4-alpha-glucosidase
MGPVRVGYDAFFQRQNDNYGSVILAVCQMFFDQRIEHQALFDLFHQLEHIGKLATEQYDQPDAGLWELRGALRIHTFSSVMCWAACDRLSKIADSLKLHDRQQFWSKWAENIKQYILEKAWDEQEQTFLSVISGETRAVDSCLLLLAELGFVDAKDEKFVKTVEVSALMIHPWTLTMNLEN